MSVLIQINGENAGEAIKELSALAAGINGHIAAPVQEEVKPSRKRTTEKPAPEASEEPKNDTAAEPISGHTSDDPVPTVVELRAKAQEVGTTPEVKKAIKALLDEFESKSISDIKEEKRAAFMSRLEGLA